MGIKLGIGPYEEDQLSPPSTQNGRLMFLSLAGGFTDSEDPQHPFNNDLPASLCDEILAPFTALVCNHFNLFSETNVGTFTSDAALYNHLKDTISREQVTTAFPDHETIRRESPNLHKNLLAWAKKWNLEQDDWCLDFAVAALRLWLFDSGEREFRSWRRAIKRHDGALWDAVTAHLEFEDNFGLRFSTDEQENISFSWASWNFLVETREEWASTIRKQFNKELKSTIGPGQKHFKQKARKLLAKNMAKHVRAVEQKIEEGDYRATPSKYDYSRHFVWLVRFQLEGWSKTRIAMHYNTQRQTVNDGIGRTAALIGLSLRGRSVGGRPKREVSVTPQASPESMKFEIVSIQKPTYTGGWGADRLSAYQNDRLWYESWKKLLERDTNPAE